MYRFRQFRLLLWKNFLLQIRRPIGTIFEILLPVAFVAILILARLFLKPQDQCFSNFQNSVTKETNQTVDGVFQSLVENYANNNLDSKSNELNFSKAAIAYHPSTNATDEVMHNVAELMGIRVIAQWKSEEEMVAIAAEMETTYYAAVVFMGNYSAGLPKHVKYVIRLPAAERWRTAQEYPNFRLREPRKSANSLYAGRFVFLQYALDASIEQLVTGSTFPYEFNLKQFPYPNYRKDYFNTTVAGILPLLLTLAFIYTAMMIVKELVNEKQCRLKESMKMMGLSNWIHWLAWFTKYFLFLFITVCLITGVLKGAKILEHSDASVVFVFFLLYITASIFFCFAISVIFSNAVLSMLFSGALWFISYVPFAVVAGDDTYRELSSGEKAAVCLLVNSCLGIGAKSFSLYEERGVGVQWSNIASSPSVDDDFSLSQVFLMFIAEIVIYGLFAWYVEAVFPGSYGIPQRPWFFVTKSYWFGTATSKVDSSIEPNMLSNLHLKNPDYEEEPTDLEVGVSICDLKKVFHSSVGKKIAVDHLSFNMFKGQITSLLGHNGAGKTTTMSILTGLFSPSSGTAYINGHSILTDMDRIRDSLGLCPQHNVLFDKLTVREHLKFFINLKGKFGPEAEQEINSMINDIQLADKQNQQSRYLSGGMKRKLSCAIALIGGSEIVFLDEPTSGMDPYARRATWDLLLKYRAGKTIILTTHFMDEADFLGERIAIMADGQLRCCGSSLFLKSRYGVGYRLTLVKGNNCDVTAISSLVYNHVQDAKMVSDVGAELAFVLPSQNSKGFETLFTELEKGRETLGINSFGVSVTTLEDVFIKVGEGLEHTVEEVVEGREAEQDTHSVDVLADPTSQLDHSELLTGILLKIHQFKAMFMKRLLHSKRNRVAVLTQLFLPLLMTFFGLIIANSVSPVSDDPSRIMTLKHLSVDGKFTKSLYASFSSQSNFTFQAVEDFLKGLKNDPANVAEKVREIMARNKGNTIFVDDTNKTVDAENCCEMEFLIINDQCKTLLQDDTRKCVPKGYKECVDDCLDKDEPKDVCPMKIKDTRPESWQTIFEEYVLRYSNAKDYFIDTVAGFTIHDDEKTNQPIYTSWFSSEALHTMADSVNAMSNLVLRSKGSSHSITAYNHPLPYSTEGKVENVLGDPTALLLGIFLNFGMSFLVASFITFLIMERESKAKHIQFISGVDTVSFWTATYLWDFINYMIPATLVIILFLIFQPDAYSDSDTLGSIYFLLILQGLSAIPFVYCLSYIFKTPLVGYAITVLVTSFIGLGLLIAVFILDASGEPDTADIINYISMLIPTYAFSSSFLDMNNNYGIKQRCTASPEATRFCEATGSTYADHPLDWESYGVGKQCLYMFLEAIVYFVLCLLIQVNFFLSSRTQDSLPNTESDGTPEDSDVAAERQRINNLNVDTLEEQAIVLKNLTKVYPRATRTAVDNLSLGVTKGNCFGLLGINGAGKTTTFGMLTGEFPISAGTAYLDGYNIQTQLRQVQQRIGYCPQFDALVDNLTGREMLEMYAHLRGVPYSKMNELVQHTIESLNLGNWADKMCGTYSGGNKRKLSTAIALVGNPPIVFLDEPTTGMDPAARRFLWNYLTSVIRAGRSIVLTSHSMEECEALCTQLAIMVNGKFKCLGGIQHLKSRFGAGYVLMLKVAPPEMHVVSSGPPSPIASLNTDQEYFHPNLSAGDGQGYNNPNVQQTGTSMTTLDGYVEQAKIFVQQTFPGAILEESRQGMLTFKITNQNMQWSYVFGALENAKERLGIVDYSVSQTSLEQVFLNFAKHQFHEERTMLKSKTCFICCLPPCLF